MHRTIQKTDRYVAYTMKDIWNDADPTLRQELKSKLGNLMSELK